jgi:hypothetical protein
VCVHYLISCKFNAFLRKAIQQFVRIHKKKQRRPLKETKMKLLFAQLSQVEGVKGGKEIEGDRRR